MGQWIRGRPLELYPGMVFEAENAVRGNILEFELRETFYAGAMGQLFCDGGQRRGGWSFRVRVGREVGGGKGVFGDSSAPASGSIQDFESLTVTQPGTFRCVPKGKFRAFRTPAARSTI